jgi:hypothetical protein
VGGHNFFNVAGNYFEFYSRLPVAAAVPSLRDRFDAPGLLAGLAAASARADTRISRQHLLIPGPIILGAKSPLNPYRRAFPFLANRKSQRVSFA